MVLDNFFSRLSSVYAADDLPGCSFRLTVCNGMVQMVGRCAEAVINGSTAGELDRPQEGAPVYIMRVMTLDGRLSSLSDYLITPWADMCRY